MEQEYEYWLALLLAGMLFRRNIYVDVSYDKWW